MKNIQQNFQKSYYINPLPLKIETTPQTYMKKCAGYFPHIAGKTLTRFS